jgi:hypothetical protein
MTLKKNVDGGFLTLDGRGEINETTKQIILARILYNYVSLDI